MISQKLSISGGIRGHRWNRLEILRLLVDFDFFAEMLLLLPSAPDMILNFVNFPLIIIKGKFTKFKIISGADGKSNNISAKKSKSTSKRRISSRFQRWPRIPPEMLSFWDITVLRLNFWKFSIYVITFRCSRGVRTLFTWSLCTVDWSQTGVRTSVTDRGIL